MRGLSAVALGLAGCAAGDGLADARLPVSTSRAEIPAAEALVAVDREGLRLDGERVASLDEVLADGPVGALDAGLRSRAAAIAAAAGRDPTAPTFRGAFSLEIDRDLPAAALAAVVTTAAGAGFGKPWVVVVDGTGQRHGVAVGLPAVAARAVAEAEAAGEVAIGGYANPTVAVLPDAGFVVTASDRVVDPGGGLAVPCGRVPCGESWPTVELTRLARRIKLDHPKDRAVVVAPAPGTTVQGVVTTFDALRDDTFAGLGARELFPVALLGEIP